MLNSNLPVLKLLAAMAIAVPAVIQAVEAPGPSRVHARITATWQGQELGAVMDRIANTQGIPIWIDRRVDPQQMVTAQFNDVNLSHVLGKVLEEAELGWSTWEGMIYIGPLESAREFATLVAIARKSVDKLSGSRRAPWVDSKAVAWPRLSNPRELLANWLSEVGITIKNPEVLSHDLWDARQLPPMPLVDRVVLLLLGYDMTCKVAASGQAIEIVPIARHVVITEQYEPGRRMRDLLAAFRDDATVVLNRQGNRVAVTGRWEDQQRAREIIDGKTPSRQTTRATPGRIQEQRFSVKLENQPVGKVIEQLAGQLGLVVEWHADAAMRRETLTSCDVQNGTVEDLLGGVLAPTGLAYSLDDKLLTIRPVE
jgi:hypothetical protein